MALTPIASLPVNPGYHSDIAGYPAVDGFAVTPSDSVNFNVVARNIYVGSAGNVALVFPSGVVQTFVSVASGTTLNVMAARINNTNTTAANILGLV